MMNCPTIFLHDISTLPGYEKVGFIIGIDRYDRVLSIARPQDLVLLKEQPDQDYLAWLEEVGLGKRNVLVLDDKDGTLPERVLHPDVKNAVTTWHDSQQARAIISPYYCGSLEERASTYLGIPMYASSKATELFNSKIHFKNLCNQIGVKTIEGTIVEIGRDNEKLRDALYQYGVSSGRVIIRGEYGASGSSVHIAEKPEDAETVIAKSIDGDRYLVEPFLKVSSSPSSLWFVTKNGKCAHMRTSDQILDHGIVHEGNNVPPQYDEHVINDIAFEIVHAMSNQGFIGALGIDFIVTNQGIFPTECNPRFTGASYPWELLNRIEQQVHIPYARAKNIHVSRDMTFAKLRMLWKDVLYDGKRFDGVVLPFNVGPLRDGKISVLGLSSSASQLDTMFSFMDYKPTEVYQIVA